MGTGNIYERMESRLRAIYKEKIAREDIDKLVRLVNGYAGAESPGELGNRWTEKDTILITYGDSIKKGKEAPLKVLRGFLNKHLKDEISVVHILPFFPYSSDDGFSVIDFMKVDPDLGTWDDVEGLNNDFDLMFDLVINHISSQSEWFKNYLKGSDPGKDYFIEVDPETDVSMVTRPRSLPLLTPFETRSGKRYLWTTFSDDQIDLNFSNVGLLAEMLKVLLEYIRRGARIIRLDAIAFLWKEVGTNCLHLPETHEMVKLFRDVAKAVDPRTIILTETNVPNEENLSYFNKGDEAHMIYQFSLPPLLLHALFKGDSTYLNNWAREIPQPPGGCTYFNFTASHDGIGVRPLEGLLPEQEKEFLYKAMVESGGMISTRRKPDGTDTPYELNITYFDAMKRTAEGADAFQAERFLASQTIMMTLQGIPAFYIHSLLATQNFNEGVEKTGRARTINRRKWELSELIESCREDDKRAFVFDELKRRIGIRKAWKVFHPDNPQQIIDGGKDVFIVKRYNEAGDEIISIANMTSSEVTISWHTPYTENPPRVDLLSGKHFVERELIKLDPYQVVWLVKEY